MYYRAPVNRRALQFPLARNINRNIKMTEDKVETPKLRGDIMQTEKTKTNGTKRESTEFRCCNPEFFQKMFEKMSKCCSGPGDSSDFSAMKGAMMKNMMEMFCGSKTTETTEDTEIQKEQEGETESAEKKG